jgi:hypothetical protein
MDYVVYREYRGEGRNFKFRYIAAPVGLMGPGYCPISLGHCPRHASDVGLYFSDKMLDAIYRPYTKREAEKRAKGLNRGENANW